MSKALKAIKDKLDALRLEARKLAKKFYDGLRPANDAELTEEINNVLVDTPTKTQHGVEYRLTEKQIAKLTTAKLQRLVELATPKKRAAINRFLKGTKTREVVYTYWYVSPPTKDENGKLRRSFTLKGTRGAK